MKLGYMSTDIQTGMAGEPIWPAGCVGSITHCRGYVCAVVADETTGVVRLGIDAEPNDRNVREGFEWLGRASERRVAAALESIFPSPNWPLLMLCAKEAAYKALFPAWGNEVELGDCTVQIETVSSDGASGTLNLAAGGLKNVRGCWQLKFGYISVLVQ